VSLGDPCGIGPEVVLKAARDPRLAEFGLVIVGDAALLSEASRRLGLGGELEVVTDAAELDRRLARSARGVRVFSPDTVACPLDLLFSGRRSADAGRASAAAVRAAVELCRTRVTQALVTAPINKEALGLAGEPYPGHTELLAAEVGSSRTRMMLAGGPLRVVLATTHLALAEVPRSLTVEGVRDTIVVARDALRDDFGVPAPRIGVCALNPHASDGGRFGDEEARVIVPAIEEARGLGVDVTGPHPADTFFARAARPGSGWDAVVAMYHDQGLIPVKLAAFGAATNVTLNIGIVRTSPDHGTAFDIAGKGVAEHDSLVQAALVAAAIARTRLQAERSTRR
jgi:4-hydroxythreonine-4-phosphate dehydrogenase